MLVADELVQRAFDWLIENSETSAQAKAARIRAEHALKRVKAQQFLSNKGTIAERDAKAIASQEYDDAVEAECAAVETDEFHKNQRNKAIAIIEAWRTEQSNMRAMGKIS